MKKQNGITLISLVVTIIVLIILAGVSINLLLGDNGIITKAKEGKEKQEIAEIKEKLGLDILDAQMEAIKRSENLEQEQLEDIISKYGQLQEDKDTIMLKDNKGTLSLLDIYNGTTVTEGSYSENKAKIELLERQVETLQKQLDDASKNSSDATKELLELKETLDKVTVTEDKMVKDFVAYKDGELITGTMTNNGTITKTLNAGESYTIPEGYHDGNGKITAISAVNYDDLIGHFTTKSASKKYNAEGGSASVTVSSSTNIDYSLYKFIEINYTAQKVNRGSATITLGSKQVSVWNSGTNTIAIPVYDFNEVGVFKFNNQDSGGGSTSSVVSITINSIKGYK